MPFTPESIVSQFHAEVEGKSGRGTDYSRQPMLRTQPGLGHMGNGQNNQSILGLRARLEQYPATPIPGGASVVSGTFEVSDNKLILTLSNGVTINCGNLNGTVIPTPFPPSSLPQSTSTPFTIGTMDFTPETLTAAVTVYKTAVLAVFAAPSPTTLAAYVTATNSLVQALLDIANASALQIEALTTTVNKILGH